MTTKGTPKSDPEIINGLSEAAQTAFAQTVLETLAPSARLRQAVEIHQVRRSKNLSSATPDHQGDG